MRDILLATGNLKKAEEMEQILASADPHGSIRWRLLSELTGWTEAIETGRTFAENAALKARHYSQWSGLWTIADDSGLEVDALHGAPGVYSARYAGEPRSDANNNALLIRRLAGTPPDRRTARFRCAVVLADGANILASAEGTVEGRIIEHPLGTNGFGYDPHFWVDSAGMTTAQMPPEQKHAISHRGQALRLLARQLAGLI